MEEGLAEKEQSPKIVTLLVCAKGGLAQGTQRKMLSGSLLTLQP